MTHAEILAMDIAVHVNEAYADKPEVLAAFMADADKYVTTINMALTLMPCPSPMSMEYRASFLEGFIQTFKP